MVEAGGRVNGARSAGAGVTRPARARVMLLPLGSGPGTKYR